MKKGDIMKVVKNSEWDAGRLPRKGDLVVVVEANAQPRVRGAPIARVLHPTVGVVYIAKHRLEAV